MSEETTIKLLSLNLDTCVMETTGESISTYTIARSMTIGNFVKLFDEWLNFGGKQLAEGKLVGLQLRFTHRTLQRQAVAFALGIIAGLSEQEYTDPRNETAIQTAKKIVQLMQSDQLPLGPYL